MKIWINKAQLSDIDDYFSNAVVFDLLNDRPTDISKSNVQTNFEEIWRRFEKTSLSTIYEDLLIVAASIFAIDKRIPRNPSGTSVSYTKSDNWTRELVVSIPVLNIDRWVDVKEWLQDTLNFLSGDMWTLHFRNTEHRYRAEPSRKKYKLVENDFDCISLFSGGLDSFSGAIKLLEEGQKVCFVGCMEYTLLNKRMLELYELVKISYKDVHTDMLVFSVRPKPPRNVDESVKSKFTEDTSRSRSLLFIAAALATASLVGNDVPVYIPENGFIGLNIPLTPSRMGSCSTRTTHVHFLKKLNAILSRLGIPHNVVNFYSHSTKGAIVQEHKSNLAFLQGAGRTISCSHPTQGRLDGASPPINCGHCFPCLIRRASLGGVSIANDIYLDDYNTDYKLGVDFIRKYPKSDNGTAKDLKAVLYALNEYLHNSDSATLKLKIIKCGGIDQDEMIAFLEVYKNSMEELKRMILNQANMNDEKLLGYVGLDREYAKAD